MKLCCNKNQRTQRDHGIETVCWHKNHTVEHYAEIPEEYTMAGCTFTGKPCWGTSVTSNSDGFFF